MALILTEDNLLENFDNPPEPLCDDEAVRARNH
jgi:hypothetical protein